MLLRPSPRDASERKSSKRDPSKLGFDFPSLSISHLRAPFLAGPFGCVLAMLHRARRSDCSGRCLAASPQSYERRWPRTPKPGGEQPARLSGGCPALSISSSRPSASHAAGQPRWDPAFLFFLLFPVSISPSAFTHPPTGARSTQQITFNEAVILLSDAGDSSPETRRKRDQIKEAKPLESQKHCPEPTPSPETTFASPAHCWDG